MADGDTFDHWYSRCRLPEEDRDAWVEVLLTCPRDRDSQRYYPTDDDWGAAVATLGASGKPRGRDDAWSLAWRMCVEREGTRLLDRLDAIEVSNYVTRGGTLREARAYLSAMTNARSQRGDWTVWARFEACFSAARYESFREMGASPADLAWFVDCAAYSDQWDVGKVHRWRLDRCQDAPWRVAATYRLYGLSDADVAGWEKRRVEGQDVVAALETLAALTGDTR